MRHYNAYVIRRRRCSSVNIVTRLRTGRPRFVSR